MFALKKKHLKTKTPTKGKVVPSLEDEMGLYSNGVPLPLRGVISNVVVINCMAEVEIIQDYINYTATPLDATFKFPLPHDAVVSVLGKNY
jgi:hypothetical protein